MTRSGERQRLNRFWWLWVALCFLPWILLGAIDFNLGLPPFAIFITGLLALFPSLKAFSSYKRALFAMREQDKAGERERWVTLQRAQLVGMCCAALPAWFAALGSLSGLEAVACLLLVSGSLMTLTLYRVPKQVLVSRLEP
jgi:hypothetical protein